MNDYTLSQQHQTKVQAFASVWRPAKQVSKQCLQIVALSGSEATLGRQPPEHGVGIQITKDKFHRPLLFQCFREAAQGGPAIPEDVLETAVLDRLAQGTDQAVISWGAKQTGKTRQLIGTKKHPGVVIRSCRNLIENFPKSTLKLCAYEVTHEKCRDLLTFLKPSKPKKKKAAKAAPELKQFTLSSMDEVLATMSHFQAIKDPLSHLVIQVSLQYEGQPKDGPARLTFIDTASYLDQEALLALKKEGALSPKVEQQNRCTKQGSQTLQQCLLKLSRSSLHVPFRDSLLTKSLTDVLRSSDISLVVCLNPSQAHLIENLEALRLASALVMPRPQLVAKERTTVRDFSQKTKHTESGYSDLIASLQSENQVLRRQLSTFQESNFDPHKLNRQSPLPYEQVLNPSPFARSQNENERGPGQGGSDFRFSKHAEVRPFAESSEEGASSRLGRIAEAKPKQERTAEKGENYNSRSASIKSPQSMRRSLESPIEEQPPLLFLDNPNQKCLDIDHRLLPHASTPEDLKRRQPLSLSSQGTDSPSPDPQDGKRRVKFAESVVTCSAEETSSVHSRKSATNPSLAKEPRLSHGQLYNDESVFKNLEIFQGVIGMPKRQADTPEEGTNAKKSKSRGTAE